MDYVDGQQRQRQFDLELDVDQDGSMVGEAVVALLKLLLYQRGQIPDTFDALAASSGSEATSSVTSVADVRRRLQTKRTDAFVDAFARLFAHLESPNTVLFDAESRVRRVALVLGSTPVTPNEVHCIEIIRVRSPRLIGVSDKSDRLRAVFRSLMSSWRRAHLPNCPMAGGKAFVLFEAPATCTHVSPLFVAKNYSPLRATGHRFTYRLTVVRHDVNVVTDRLFDVYESPAVAATTTTTTTKLHSPMSVFDSKPDVDDALADDEKMFTWFQSSVAVRR